MGDNIPAPEDISEYLPKNIEPVELKEIEYDFIDRFFRVIKEILAHLKHPKKLILTKDMGEYIYTLFMGGADPAEIARGMDAVYGRKFFPFFQVYNVESCEFEWKPADYEIEGLEFIRSAAIAIGAMTPKKDGDYWEKVHPMTKRIFGEIGINAAVPCKKP